MKCNPGIFRPSEYDTRMIITKSGGKTGIVMVERVGHFRFGPTGAPIKQLKSGVQRVMYSGNGVSPNN